jgi:large subunit ribosomal protein L19e
MTNLRLQKRLASKALGVGRARVKLDSGMAEEIKEAITREDIKELVKDGIIEIIQKKGVSRHRARARHLQKRKGRQRGHGNRKGKAGARTPKKQVWMAKIRRIRAELKSLRDDAVLVPDTYRILYRRAGGGFFRDRNHLLVYIKQHKLAKKSIDERMAKKKKVRKTIVKKKVTKKVSKK